MPGNYIAKGPQTNLQVLKNEFNQKSDNSNYMKLKIARTGIN